MVRVKLCSMCQLLSQSRTGQTTCARWMQTQHRPPTARWALLLSVCDAHVTVWCRRCSSLWLMQQSPCCSCCHSVSDYCRSFTGCPCPMLVTSSITQVSPRHAQQEGSTV